MPGYKGHLAGGLIASVMAVFVVSFFMPIAVERAIELSISALFGALFPDIDTKSKGQMLFYRFFLILFVVLMVKQHFQTAALLSSLLFFPILSRHRGLFHRVWFLSGIAFVAIWIVTTSLPDYSPWLIGNILFFYLGALSHVWLDIGIRGMIRLK